jgi:tetratricopeptide (TPR) repeat protein
MRFHWKHRGVRAVLLACVSYFCWAPQLQAQSDTSQSVSNSSLREAAAALAGGDLKSAEISLQQILHGNPNDVHALNLLGIIRAQQKREPEAESIFKQAISADANFAGAHSSLGLLYVQMGKEDQAIPEFRETLRLDPRRDEARSMLISLLRTQAHSAAEHSELEKSLALLIEARKASPVDPGVQFDFAMVALQMSLFSDAVNGFNEALKLRPDDPKALYGLGRAQIGMAKFDDGQRTFDRYVQLRADDPSGHYALGFTLEAMQQPEAARAEYEKSIELQPLQTESYFRLGMIDLDAGNLRSASDKFNRVLKRAAHHAGALTGMGRVKFQDKQYSDAADFLNKAIAENPNLREAHYYLGMTYARLGRSEDSDRELQTASRIEHEEVEQHQSGFKIVDPDIDSQSAKPAGPK